MALKARAAKSDVSVLEVKIDKENNLQKLGDLKADLSFDKETYRGIDKKFRAAKQIADAARTEYENAKESAERKHDPDALKKNSAALLAAKKKFDKFKAQQSGLVKENLLSDHKLKLARASLMHAKKTGDGGLIKKAANLVKTAEKHKAESKKQTDSAADEMEDSAMTLQKLSKKQAKLISMKFKAEMRAAVKHGKDTRKKALIMREAQKMKRDELQRAADRFGAQAAAADKVAKEAEETVQSAKSRSRAMKKEAHEKDKDYGPLLLFVEKSRHAEETAEKEKILAEKSEEPAAITI